MSPSAQMQRAIAVVAVFAAACLSRDMTAPPPDQRLTTFVVRADVSAAAPAVAMVVVEVTAPDITTPLVFNIPIVSGVATGPVTLPAGANRTITMHAYDIGGVETHRGAVTVAIRPGANPPITIVLAPLNGSVPITVTLGTVTITIAPKPDTLSVGDTVTVTAKVVLSDGTPLTGLVSWATFGPGVATVQSTADQTGRVTGVGAGQTSIVAVYAATAGAANVIVSAVPALQLVASGLAAVTYVTAPPNDTARVFLVEQRGVILLVKNGVVVPTPFLDIQSIVSGGGERGLLSMAFHPNYALNGEFFVDYTDLLGNIQVVRYKVSTTNPDLADPSSALTILSITHTAQSNHNGGLVMFGPDGYLYIGVGDGGGVGDPMHNGQDSTTLLGKILRIDVNSGSPYAIPPSNPFVGRPPAAPEVWEYGLRNPWRFAFDSGTADLYIADVGQDSMEEVDVHRGGTPGGENYGWNIMEGTLCYSPPTGCNQTGLVLPVFGYHHGVNDANGCAIVGGYPYRGTRFPALIGRYFYADLCGGWIRSFRYSGGVVSGIVDYTPQFGTLTCGTPGVSYTISSFGEDARGELYVMTVCGSVYRIVPK